MYGFWGAGASQPDLRCKEDKQNRKSINEKASVSDENLGNGQQRWYSRFNPINPINSLISIVKRTFSYQSLTGSESNEESYANDFSRTIKNATIKIVQKDETCTTDANAVILFHTKESVTNMTGHYRFPFKRKSNKPETGDFQKDKKIKTELSKKSIYITDEDGGIKVIHVLVDLGFIPEAVSNALDTTGLMTTVDIVFESKERITDYASDICKDVLNFCLKGLCKYKRTIVFDVRADDKFCLLKDMVMTMEEEESRYDWQSSNKGIQNIICEHDVTLQCVGFVTNTKVQEKYDQPYRLHNVDVIKWQHLCENALNLLKKKLEEKCCIVKELSFKKIEVECFEALSSRSQFKKWRSEVLGLIKQIVSEPNIATHDVEETMLMEVVQELIENEDVKSSSISIIPSHDNISVILCGLELDVENAAVLVQDAINTVELKRQRCLFSKKMSNATFEVVLKSDCFRKLRMKFKDTEIMFNKSRSQLDAYGPRTAKEEITKKISDIINNLSEMEVKISAALKKLMLTPQTQHYIKLQLEEKCLNCSVDISKELNPDYSIKRIKVTVIGESDEMCSLSKGIVKSSVKKYSESTREPKMARLLDCGQWKTTKEDMMKKHEGKLLIERDSNKHLINIICTNDIKEEIVSWLEEQKELKIAKKVLPIEADKFEYLNKWHRHALDSFVKAIRVAISVKTPFVNKAQSKPCFEIEGSKDDIEKVLSYINDDLFEGVVTKTVMISDSSLVQFLSRNDDSVFDYLTKSKKCFIRIEIVGVESLEKWTSPCGRLFYVSKGKANDAEIIIRLKQHKTARSSMKTEPNILSKYEELVVPYSRGAIEKDIFNSNIDDLLRRLDERPCRVVAFPALMSSLFNTQLEDIIQTILERIQTYTNLNESFSVRKIYFHDLWEDRVFNSVVTVLNDFFDDRDRSIDEDAVFEDFCDEDEQIVRPRMMFITGQQDAVNDINIPVEIQDLIRRQNSFGPSLSRSGSSDSLFNKSDTGSIESITLLLRKSTSEPDIPTGDINLAEGNRPKDDSADKTLKLQNDESQRKIQKWTSQPNFAGNSSDVVQINEKEFDIQERIANEGDYDEDSPKKERWNIFRRSKKKKKNKQLSKSTPNLPPVEEENHCGSRAPTSKGHRFRKSHDNRFDAAALEDTLRDYSGSIGLIIIKSGHNNETTGTCFMVNGGYVMSSYHIFKDIQERCKHFGKRHREKEWHDKVHTIFGYKHIQKKTTHTKYKFHPYPVCIDPEIDLIILKLDEKGPAFPNPIQILGCEIPESVKGITFLGYPKGRPLAVDPNCQILSADGSSLKQAKDYVKKNFPQHSGCYNGIEDKRYYMVHSQEEPGNSGSPGFIIGPLERPVVCCMFLSIFPEFVFDKLTGEPQLPFPNKHMIERALKMSAVFETLERNYPELCSQIFVDDRDVSMMECE